MVTANLYAMRSDNEEKVRQQNAINLFERLLGHCNETINKGLCRTTKPFVKRCCSFVGELIDCVCEAGQDAYKTWR